MSLSCTVWLQWGLQECLCVTKSWSEKKIKAFTCSSSCSNQQPARAGQTKTNWLSLKIKCDDATFRTRWYLTKIFVDSRFLFNEHGTSPDIICKADPEVSAYKQLTLKHKWSWRHFSDRLSRSHSSISFSLSFHLFLSQNRTTQEGYRCTYMISNLHHY